MAGREPWLQISVCATLGGQEIRASHTLGAGWVRRLHTWRVTVTFRTFPSTKRTQNKHHGDTCSRNKHTRKHRAAGVARTHSDTCPACDPAYFSFFVLSICEVPGHGSLHAGVCFGARRGGVRGVLVSPLSLRPCFPLFSFVCRSVFSVLYVADPSQVRCLFVT